MFDKLPRDRVSDPTVVPLTQMIVSAWHNGHGSYGLRIMGRRNLGLWFRPEWDAVSLYLPDEDDPIRISITDSFWTSNPELRDRDIKRFLIRNGLVPWEKNHPPHFELEPMGGGEFRLKWFERVERQPRLRLDA